MEIYLGNFLCTWVCSAQLKFESERDLSAPFCQAFVCLFTKNQPKFQFKRVYFVLNVPTLCTCIFCQVKTPYSTKLRLRFQWNMQSFMNDFCAWWKCTSSFNEVPLQNLIITIGKKGWVCTKLLPRGENVQNYFHQVKFLFKKIH